jgi:DNA primase catalytic core
VTRYVPALKRSGRSWKAPCPFHTERTPSFIVDPGRGTWHCFGACSTGGDVIEFVRRVEGLEFREALRRCADFAGIELRPPTAREQREREEHERLLSANEAASIFFQAQLDGPDGAEALAYAEGRGLDAETRRAWQLGYAPESWSALLDHLLARGYTEEELIRAGLVVESDRPTRDGRRSHDRFRDRLLFPTRDERGRLVGFGGRALRPEDEPKYLNTPQTPLFDKSGTLYGLDRAADAARRGGQVIVVEGYMDVIAAHQFGVTNVVASNGTSITERQMRLLKRYTPNVVLALDADAAGSEAALRGVEVAAGAADRQVVAGVDWRGLVSTEEVLDADIRVATLPAGEDPDSLVRADPEAFRALVAGALPVADHLFQAVTAASDLHDPRARSRALTALAPTVAVMADPVVRAHYVQRLARIGRVDERYAEQLVAQARRGRVRIVESGERSLLAPPGRAGRTAVVSGRAPALDGEAQLLRLLLASEECREAGLALDADLFEDSANRELYATWREQPGLAGTLDALDDEPRERAEALLARPLPPHEPADLTAMVGEIAIRLRDRRQHARLRERATEVAEELVAARRFAAASPATVAVASEPAASEGMTEDEDKHEGGGDANAERGDTVALAAELSELAERQRRLARVAAGGERDTSGPEGTGGEIIEAGAARDGGGRS